MNVLACNKKALCNDLEQSDAIHTNLYDLVEAVMSSTRPEEGHLANLIVLHMLDAGKIRMAKALSENIRE